MTTIPILLECLKTRRLPRVLASLQPSCSINRIASRTFGISGPDYTTASPSLAGGEHPCVDTNVRPTPYGILNTSGFQGRYWLCSNP